MADALPQISLEVELQILSAPALLDSEMVLREVGQDEELQLIIAKLKEDPSSVLKFTWENRWLLYKGMLVISSSPNLIPSLLQMHHDLVMGGHSRCIRTYKWLSNELYWKVMKKRVQDYVAQC